MAAPDRMERRLWWAALVYLGAIYLSLYPLQFAMDLLRRHNLLRVAIGATFLAAAGAGLLVGVRRGWRARQWLVAGAGALVVGYLALRLDVVQERLHLVEYGALGLLFWAALARRDERLGRDAVVDGVRTVVLATLLVGAAGWLDEGIQGLLPNRVYDLRDVGLNAGAGALAACFAEVHRRLGDSRGQRR